MATPAQKTKVGAFLIMSLSVIGSILFIMSGMNTDTRTPYWMEFEQSVQGLNSGGLVAYRGVPAGEVIDIFVTNRGTTRVEIQVNDSKVTLRRGVRAKLVIISLATGNMAVELEGGDIEKEKLRANSEIPTQGSFFENMSSQLESVLSDVSEVTHAIRVAMEGMASGAVPTIINDVQLLVEDLRAFVESAEDSQNRLVESLDMSILQYGELAQDLRTNLDTAAKNTNKILVQIDDKLSTLDIERAHADLQKLMVNIGDLAQKMQDTVDLFNSGVKTVLQDADSIEYSLRRTLESATKAMDAVADLGQTLEEDPASILRGRGTPKE